MRELFISGWAVECQVCTVHHTTSSQALPRYPSLRRMPADPLNHELGPLQFLIRLALPQGDDQEEQKDYWTPTSGR